jgi:intracellular sulfur oxidation DsrE/DsrF family protein
LFNLKFRAFVLSLATAVIFYQATPLAKREIKRKEYIMKPAALLFAILLAPVMTYANQYTDADALKGLKRVKVVCDVNVGDPKLLLRRLELIDETYTQLMDAGVQATFVVAFRGPATKYVTRATAYVPPGHHAFKKEIQGWVAQFHENGFSLEQCAIAARGQKVSYGDVLPQITIVRNGYISLVAYQNRGYALLPMD